jgi:hypothetical protein
MTVDTSRQHVKHQGIFKRDLKSKHSRSRRVGMGRATQQYEDNDSSEENEEEEKKKHIQSSNFQK